MRKSILLLEKELAHIDELIKKCESKDCNLKCNTENCHLHQEKIQLSRDIQTLYRGK